MKLNESLLLQRHGKEIEAVLGCYDRLVITGTLLEVAYPAAVPPRLNERALRCLELGEFAGAAISTQRLRVVAPDQPKPRLMQSQLCLEQTRL